MSDEKTVYIDPDDDLTTVRESLDKIPSRKITLVIPSQTQLRSHVAWKLLYARARELNKEVVIVSSDPQVRSVAHAVKFKVAHSLESTSNSGRPKSGSRPSTTGRGHSGTTRSRLTTPSSPTAHATAAKESSRRRGESRSTRPPASGQAPGWSELDSILLPERPDSLPSRFDEPHTIKPDEPRPQHLVLPERDGIREERTNQYNQIYDYRPETAPAIRPLPANQIEEPDLLIEDYNRAQDILQAATGSHPVVQESQDTESAITSSSDANMPMPETAANSTPADQLPRPQVYGEEDPFIYMQDDASSPSQSEQKGEAILQDDEISLDFALPQPSAISDLPTNVIESEVTYLGDDDDAVMQFPISPYPIAQEDNTHALPVNEEDETTENKPSDESPRLYNVPSWDSHVDTLPPPEQTFNEEEDQLPPLPESSVPTQRPEPIALPVPRVPSRPLAPVSRPLPRTGRQVQQQVPTQKPTTEPGSRNVARVSPTTGSRPSPLSIPARGGPARTKGTVGTIARQPGTKSPSRGPRRLFFVLASILALLVILFAVAYLNTASTVMITVATQDYTPSVTFKLSNQSQPDTVHAVSLTRNFPSTASGIAATGSTMLATNRATGFVYFTNKGTVAVQIPSQTVLATKNNVRFATTANALILPQSANPVPVPIQASDQGQTGNVPPGSITVIPSETLASIAQTQSPSVPPESLGTTLTVSNPEATTGGEAHQVPAVAQQDLDKATNNPPQQVLDDINAWVQQNTKIGLVGKPVTTNKLVNPPALDTAEPDKTFSVTLNVAATLLLARLDDVQRVAINQLNTAIQTDKRFEPGSGIVGTIHIDLTQQKALDSNTVTVPARGKVGPNLNTTDLQNSLKGKSLGDARTFLRQRNRHIQKVDIQTQPALFWWVSPWADHIHVNILSAT